jgi:hypothetical protein
MKTRNFALCALGLAAAISLGGAATASAQRATSPTRIPVRKDMRQDTVTVTRVDTIIRTRVDTVMMPGRVETRTVTRVDTVIRIQELPKQRLPGLYFGLGGGLAIPMNSWRNSTKDGPAIQGQVGWFPKDGALGIRIDGLANFLSHRATDCPNCPDPRLYEGNADLVLRLPLDRTSKLNPVIYFMGGGGLDKFTDFLPYRNTDNQVVSAGGDTYLNYPGLPLSNTAGSANFSGDKTLFFNYNAGGGLDFNVGGAHLYVETKFTTINTTGGSSHYWPTIIGFKFY